MRNSLVFICIFVIFYLISCNNSIIIINDEMQIINLFLNKLNFNDNIILINPEFDFSHKLSHNLGPRLERSIQDLKIGLKDFVNDDILVEDFVRKNSGKNIINKKTRFNIPIQYLDDFYNENEQYFNELEKKMIIYKNYENEITRDYLLLIDETMDRIKLMELLKQKKLELGIIEIERIEIVFSRVGFNRDKTKAIIYFSYQKYKGFGVGQYFLLEKEDNIWKIFKEKLVWIT